MVDWGKGTQSILILGGLGYFGSRLAQHWARDHRVTVTYRQNKPARKAWAESVGIRVVALSEVTAQGGQDSLRNFDLLVNLATPGAAECQNDFETAVNETQQIVKWCVGGMKSGRIGRLVHFSSFHVYGNVRESYRETDEAEPKTPYARVHWESEKTLASLWADLAVAVVRPSNLVGYPAHPDLGDQARLLAMDLCKQALSGSVTLNNDGNSYRDFLSFENAIKAVEKIAAPGNRENKVFNLAAGKSVKICDFVAFLKEACQKKGKNLEVRFGTGTDPYRVPFQIDIDRLNQLGWRPEADLDTTILRILEAFES